MQRPSLALVVIVRDQAQLLTALLAEHRELYDKAVVVDTGSRDDSATCASKAGAQVVRHHWEDDFAAARNAGLAAARADWILILDADERIDARDFPRLRSAIAVEPDRCYLQTTVNYVNDSRHPEWQPVAGAYPELEKEQSGFFTARRIGLFPALPDLRFSGRIHESVLPAAQRLGLPVVALDAPVHHFGHVLSAAASRERRLRDARLVRAKLAEDPTDRGAALEMAAIHLEEGNPAAARAELERLVDGAADGVIDRALTRARVLLARMRHEEGDAEAACALLEQCVADEPTHLFGWITLIRYRGQGERWSAVQRDLATARRHCGDGPLLAREEFRYLVMTARLPEAAGLLRTMIDRYPSWRELGALAERMPAAGDPTRP